MLGEFWLLWLLVQARGLRTLSMAFIIRQQRALVFCAVDGPKYLCSTLGLSHGFPPSSFCQGRCRDPEDSK